MALGVAAIVGGICLTLFDVQPGGLVSISPPGNASPLFQHSVSASLIQSIFAIRFLIIALALVAGIIYGTVTVMNKNTRYLLPWMVATLLLTGISLSIFISFALPNILTFFTKVVAGALFSFIIGLIWGCMPTTTSVSGLIKWASLGDISSMLKLLISVILGATTSSVFSRIGNGNATALVAAFTLQTLAIVLGLRSVDMYIKMYDDNVLKPTIAGNGFTRIAFPAIIFGLPVLLYTLYKMSPI